MASGQTPIRTLRGIPQPFLFPLPLAPRPTTIEAKGAVFTKRWVVDLLLDLAGYCSANDLAQRVAVEPSAGDGAFLGPMIERLVDSCERHHRSIATTHNALVAYELDQASAEIAKELATNTLVKRGVSTALASELADGWVRTGDYLLESFDIEADFVIGNPPYVRLEEIPEDTALLYRATYTTMRGRADLYVAFFEAALRQLKDGAVCSFICADRWMRNQYGAELRGLISSRFSVEVLIEMHNANAFQDEVDAYPAITVIRRRAQTGVLVASVGPEIESNPFHALTSGLFDRSMSHPELLPQNLHAKRIGTWFKGSDPWPFQSPEQLALLRRLEDQFPPLEANAKVGIGVATGNDKLFITKDADLVERSRLLKLAMARDIRGGTLQWSGHYLVDPWDQEGLVSLPDYPRLADYFARHSEALKKRHTAQKNTLGWYKTIDRVSHALCEEPKLYIADIKEMLDPVLDKGETYPHHNLYYIQSDEWDLEVLGGLLISCVGQFFVESYGVRMRGGYLRFQAQYLRRIRVPSPGSISDEERRELRDAFRARDRQRATELAIRIYGITAEEMEKALGPRSTVTAGGSKLLGCSSQQQEEAN